MYNSQCYNQVWSANLKHVKLFLMIIQKREYGCSLKTEYSSHNRIVRDLLSAEFLAAPRPRQEAQGETQ